ncbi:MAG: twin-arginine translocase TatA/TatE family subunit [Prolixibacteraceae bacterium]|jgi:sec-independent protein translocase protein TatA|nr:twin-arginine translocase TatA/TatE family subunit [Prolixibacteraceae bacterium]
MSLNIIAGWFGGQEVIIILIIVLIFFGGRKIPELMKGLGKGMKEFKDATSEDEKKDQSKSDEEKK